jgi:HSP20 family protein
MKVRDPTLWMWGEALDVLERADRLQRQFFQLGSTPRTSPAWEPPVDIFETGDRLVIVIALPGVAAEQLSIEVEPGALVVRGQRRLPLGHGCHIHRLELPYGRFERRIELPLQRLELADRQLADGCLTLSLTKPEPP